MISDLQPRTFDDSAGAYDEVFSNRLPALWLRSMVQARVIALLPPAARILEVGCGTGEDAIRLAELGHNVLATDISDKMLQEVLGKLQRESASVSNRVRIARLDAADPAAARVNDDHDLDLVFSNFGALNCIADLRPLFDYADERLKPGGHLALTMMGRFCIWETLGFLLRGDLRRAVRRWSGTSEYRTSNAVQDIWYPSVGAVKRMIPVNFRSVSVSGVGVLLPSTEFFDLCERWPRLFHRLFLIENAIGSWWPVNRLGDHFLIVLRKNWQCREQVES